MTPHPHGGGRHLDREAPFELAMTAIWMAMAANWMAMTANWIGRCPSN